MSGQNDFTEAAPQGGEYLKLAAFHHRREIPASAEAVFQAISNPERLARWWGPDGFTNTIHKFEFASGGDWHLTMHGPDGANYLNHAVFKEVVPDARVIVEHVSQPHFVLTMSLTPTANGMLVSWVQEFDNPAVAEGIRHIVEPANEQNLARWEREVMSAPSANTH